MPPTLILSYDNPVKIISYPDMKKQIPTFTSHYYRKQSPRGYLSKKYLKVHMKSCATKLLFGNAAN